jgi:hypothetical protein
MITAKNAKNPQTEHDEVRDRQEVAEERREAAALLDVLRFEDGLVGHRGRA